MKKLHLGIILASYALLVQGLLAGPISTQIFGWGYNGVGAAIGISSPSGHLDIESGAVTLPRQPLTNIIAIAAGSQHGLALRADGMVVGWGYNNCGQATGDATNTSPMVTINGGVLSNVVAVSAGLFHSLALKRDGKVVAWGNQPNVPPELSNVVAIAAGMNHSLALKKDGTVVMWPNPIRAGWRSPSFLDHLSNVVAIAAAKPLFGYGMDMVVKSDGSVLTWSIKNGESHSISGVSNVVAVAAGLEGLALTRDGTVFKIGPHSDNDTHSDEARPVIGLSNVVAIAAGERGGHAVRRDGTVETIWPDGYPHFPLDPPHLTNIIDIAQGDNFSVALQTNSP